MLTPDEVNMRAAILSGVPGDGSAIGNIALAKAVTQHMGAGFNPAVFEAARLALVAAGAAWALTGCFRVSHANPERPENII